MFLSEHQVDELDYAAFEQLVACRHSMTLRVLSRAVNVRLGATRRYGGPCGRLDSPRHAIYRDSMRWMLIGLAALAACGGEPSVMERCTDIATEFCCGAAYPDACEVSVLVACGEGVDFDACTDAIEAMETFQCVSDPCYRENPSMTCTSLPAACGQ